MTPLKLIKPPNVVIMPPEKLIMPPDMDIMVSEKFRMLPYNDYDATLFCHF